MGSRTDARIAAWQEETGIKPATGKRAELLRASFPTSRSKQSRLSNLNCPASATATDAGMAVIQCTP